jgi:hypothetical protein
MPMAPTAAVCKTARRLRLGFKKSLMAVSFQCGQQNKQKKAASQGS